MVKIAAVIPARMASSRFPGKPLLKFHGLPMVEHVRRRALLCKGFSEVVVATCDEEIALAIRSFGGRVVMTSASHPAATDRVAEAARSLDCTHVMNIQGDEILVLPEDLDRFTRAIREGAAATQAWNATAPLEHSHELSDTSVVKCAVSRSERILFCSRDFTKLPLKKGFEPLRVILGILAYEKGLLSRYAGLPRTPCETAEAIDQSRLIESDIVLQGVPFRKAYPGINEPREVPPVEEFLRDDPRQRAVLEQILAEASIAL